MKWALMHCCILSLGAQLCYWGYDTLFTPIIVIYSKLIIMLLLVIDVEYFFEVSGFRFCKTRVLSAENTRLHPAHTWPPGSLYRWLWGSGEKAYTKVT